MSQSFLSHRKIKVISCQFTLAALVNFIKETSSKIPQNVMVNILSKHFNVFFCIFHFSGVDKVKIKYKSKLLYGFMSRRNCLGFYAIKNRHTTFIAEFKSFNLVVKSWDLHLYKVWSLLWYYSYGRQFILQFIHAIKCGQLFIKVTQMNKWDRKVRLALFVLMEPAVTVLALLPLGYWAM